VTQTQQQFGYYHTHIYLLDERGEKLVVAEGTGPAGAALKQNQHSIPLNASTSLVAQAARTGQIVQVDNVRENKGWLPNPLLPDTYSEMAVPIILDEKVVGVLDVQEDKIAGLDEGDVSVLRSLANQVAVAIRNSRLFAEVEMALNKAHEAQKRYTTQEWQKIAKPGAITEHLYLKSSAASLSEDILAAAEAKALTQERSVLVSWQGEADFEDKPQTLVAPVKLDNQVIGTVQVHRLKHLDDEATGNKPVWTEQDLVFIETVLDQLAQTAENLRLFDETRERAGRETTIREITDKLRAAPNIDILLETAARELGQRLEVRHTVLELGIETHSDEQPNGHNLQEK
jgi:GAF domain-containing protein